MPRISTLILPYTIPIEKNTQFFSCRYFVDSKKAYFFFKRVFDLVFSTLFIILLLSWITPLIAILIKIGSKGPVFFFQKRVGRGGRSFYCIKFRTMCLNKESDEIQAEKNDHRITGIGRFLRKSNLDELPQLLNVLKGQMSIIGPRPHMHADCTRFSAVVPGYKFRNLVKPGITGLAQIKGFHGPCKTDECIFRRFQWDAFYIRNAGFSVDLRILRKTAGQRLAYFISGRWIN